MQPIGARRDNYETLKQQDEAAPVKPQDDKTLEPRYVTVPVQPHDDETLTPQDEADQVQTHDVETLKLQDKAAPVQPHGVETLKLQDKASPVQPHDGETWKPQNEAAPVDEPHDDENQTDWYTVQQLQWSAWKQSQWDVDWDAGRPWDVISGIASSIGDSTAKPTRPRGERIRGGSGPGTVNRYGVTLREFKDQRKRDGKGKASGAKASGRDDEGTS
jgi:hypothetical protein